MVADVSNTAGSDVGVPVILDVTWRDARYQLDWDGPPEDYLVHTIGYLAGDGQKFVSIAGEMLPDGDGFRGVTDIPVDCVIAREVIRPVPTMSLMTSIGAIEGGK